MDRYISNRDLARFSIGQRLTGVLPLDPGYHHIDELPPLDVIFEDPEVYYTFIFLENPDNEVGHWVLLIKLSEDKYEYFDCLAKPIPQQVLNLFAGTSAVLESCQKALMNRKGIICGKWCMFRVSTLPHSLTDFYAMFKHWKREPDELVDFIVNIPIKIID